MCDGDGETWEGEGGECNWEGRGRTIGMLTELILTSLLKLLDTLFQTSNISVAFFVPHIPISIALK